MSCYVDEDTGEVADSGTIYVSGFDSEDWADTGEFVIASGQIEVGNAYKCVYTDDDNIESGTIHMNTGTIIFNSDFPEILKWILEFLI